MGGAPPGPGRAAPGRLAYRLDAKGRTLIPSFIDGHTRLMDTGIRLMTLDLSDTTTLAQAQAQIAAHARANPARKWILGSGWDAARWGMTTAPTAAQLDAAISDMPAWLESADGHTGGPTAPPCASPVSGRRALSPARPRRKWSASSPAPSPKDRDIALDKAQRFLTTALPWWRTWVPISSIGRPIAGRATGAHLRLRIIGYADGIENMATIAGPAPSPWLYDDRLRLVGVHLPVDATADITRLSNQASRAAMDGFQLALTPDGEPALRKATSVMREMTESYPGDRRWRTEDGQAAVPSFMRLAQLAAREGAIGAAWRRSPAVPPMPHSPSSELVRCCPANGRISC